MSLTIKFTEKHVQFNTLKDIISIGYLTLRRVAENKRGNEKERLLEFKFIKTVWGVNQNDD